MLCCCCCYLLLYCIIGTILGFVFFFFLPLLKLSDMIDIVQIDRVSPFFLPFSSPAARWLVLCRPCCNGVLVMFRSSGIE